MFDECQESAMLAKIAQDVGSQPEILGAGVVGWTSYNGFTGFAIDLSVSLDFAYRLSQASKGIFSANTSVLPEINTIYTYPSGKTYTNWFNNYLSPWYGAEIEVGTFLGWPAARGTYIVQTPPWPVSYENLSIAVAVKPDGKTVKVSIVDDQGVLNLTAVANSDGSVSISTNGWMKFSRNNQRQRYYFCFQCFSKFRATKAFRSAGAIPDR